MRARPLVLLTVVSRTLSVIPTLLPVIDVPVVSPNVTPHIWLLEPRVNSSALLAVTVGFVPPVEGRRLVPEGADNPVIVSKIGRAHV